MKPNQHFIAVSEEEALIEYVDEAVTRDGYGAAYFHNGELVFIKPIDPPTEEEIHEVIDMHDSFVLFNGHKEPEHCILPNNYKMLAKAILKLINGER